MHDSYKDKLRLLSTGQLLDELDYCGWDMYYNGMRKQVVDEIERRLNEWRPAIAPVEDGGGVFICGNQGFDCGSVGKRNIITNKIEQWFYYCPVCGCKILWEDVDGSQYW